MALPGPRWLSATLVSAALIAAVTAVIALLEPRVSALGLAVLYLLAVVPIALVYGAVVAGAASLASMAAFNFYFITPRHSLDPGTFEQWAVLVAFLLSSFVVILLATRAQRELRRTARLADEQAALRRVATLVARVTRPEEVFAAVVEEVGRLLSVEMASMGRYESAKSLVMVAAWGTDIENFSVGTRRILGGENLGTIVHETGCPARIDNYDDRSSGQIGNAARKAGVRSSVAAPIVVDGRLWGVISASSTLVERLPADAEARLAEFTELAATAISNAESRSGLTRLADEQAALRRVATLVAQGVPTTEVVSALGEEVSLLLDAEATVIGRIVGDGKVAVLAISGASGDKSVLGIEFEPDPDTVLAEVLASGRSARKDDYNSAEPALRLGIRCGVGVPIVVEGALWGIVAIGTVRERFPDDTEQRLEAFTELAATAIANAESRSELGASRARIITASDEARRRIERDLHDGAQQRLVSLSLDLRTAESMIPAESEELRGTLDRVAGDLVGVIDELREISRGIHPTILSEGGLGPALRTLARRSALPVELGSVVDGRLPAAIEVAAYYVVSEALTNATKHAKASRVEIGVSVRAGNLCLSIGDDGNGGADPEGSGLVGLRDRVEALGGAIEIRSPPGRGTSVVARLPLELELIDEGERPAVRSPEEAPAAVE